MKIGVFADNLWGLRLIKVLYSDKNFIIDYVVLRNKKDFKILNFCKKKRIKYYNFKNINNLKNIKILKKFNSDILVSMSYDQIFKKIFFNELKKKIINCHAGALPFYRGRSPINWAIIRGEKKIGITTHYIDSKIDTGNIINQKFLKIRIDDNYKTILEKCYKECPIQLYRVLNQIRNKRSKEIKQSSISKKSSYFFKRKKGDEIINFDSNFKDINNFIRGLVFPSVGATFEFKNKSYITLKANFLKNVTNNYNSANGTILSVSSSKIKIKVKDSIMFISKIFIKKNNKPIKDLRNIFKKNLILKGKK